MKPIIAIMYDFDKTLCTKDMQEYTFIPKVDMTPADFWRETTILADSEKMDRVLTYMYMMIKKAKSNDVPIVRENFVEMGKDIELFPGVADWFDRINQFGEEQGVEIQHYIISSGLKEIIEGSEIYHKFKEVFACEFFYDVNKVARWPKNVVNYTTKTQFLFRINKQVLDISEDDKLNEYTPESERPVPFKHMIYLGDGITDVPCMKLVKVNGGYSIAVYPENGVGKAQKFLDEGRVNSIQQADYREGSELDETIKTVIRYMSVN